MSDGQWAEWHQQEEDARRDALATAKEDRHVTEHTHHFMGQELRHSHPGGQDEHGYFEHPEDGARAGGTAPLAVELAEVIRAQKMAGVDMVRSAPGEIQALRKLAAAVQAHLLAQPEPAPGGRYRVTLRGADGEKYEQAALGHELASSLTDLARNPAALQVGDTYAIERLPDTADGS